MEEAIVFKRENFNIAKDIRLEADVAYIQGHPIVKTKSVVLYYRGTVFRASESHTAFTERLIKDVTDPVYVVELMNYLSMLINDNFLFEIYAKRPQEPESLADVTFVKLPDSMRGRAPPHYKLPKFEVDASLYHKGLIDDSRHFAKAPLLETMNERFSRTFSSIEELNYVPVYGYISSNTKLGHSKIAEPVLHLAIVFNVLAHQDRFSGINNQEAISSFNSIMKAKRLNTTVETLNIHEYKNEIKRLQLELQRERERANGLEIAKKTLEEKFDDFRAEVNAREQQAQAERQQLINEVHHANNELANANAKLDETKAQNTQLQTKADTLQTTMNHLQEVVIEAAQTLHDELHAASEMVREQFTSANVTTSSRLETIDVWNIKELDDYYHRTHQCGVNEHVLDTFCGDAKKPSRINQHRFKPKETDELIGSYPNANAIDLAVFLRRHHDDYPHVRMNQSRKLIYSDGQLDEVRALLVAYSDEGDGRIIEVVDNFELRSENAGNQMITHLQAIFNQQQANAQAIAHLQEQEEAHHQEAMEAIAHIEEQLTTYQLFKQEHPRARQHRHRHFYRNVNEDEDGRAWCEDTKGGARYYLTEDDIKNGAFR